MGKRPAILVGMAAAAAWAVLVVASGPQWPNVQPLWQTLALAGLCAGLPLFLIITRIAQRRFFDDDLIDGEPAVGGAEIDQRVLQNTVEQVALAVCLWPAIGALLGPGTVIALGLSFVMARLAFWLGYHLWAPLRAFGFAATFYPTVLAAIVGLWHWAVVDLPT